MLKRFIDLSNFQQWVLFYIISNGKINIQVKNEINNFCDKTKNSINLNNFDEEMVNLQKELDYFSTEGLLHRVSADTLVLSAKGDLYCFQNLNQHLEKLSLQSVLTKMSDNNIYRTSKVLCDAIFHNYASIKIISQLLIGDPKDTMTRIQIFVEIIRALSNISI